MNTQQIKYFIEVAEYGSMLKVAENNFVTQPAVSSAISKLEAELGVQLIHRSKRGITLTEAGDVALKQFLLLRKISLQLSVDLEPYRENSAEITSNTIKLCATLEITNSIMKHIMEQFYMLHPNSTCTITEYDFQNVISAVKNDNADLGIFYILDEILCNPKLQAILQENNLHLEKLGQDALAAGVSVHSPLAKSNSISLKTLAQNRIVAYNSSTEDCWQKHFLEQYNPNLHLIATNSLVYCGELIANRNYLAFFLNQKQMVFSNEMQRIFKILPIKENKKTTICLVYKNDILSNTLANDFVILLKKHLTILYSN